MRIAEREAVTPAPITIQPSRGWVSFGVREVWNYRELLYFFAWRDLKVRYKQSLVGIGWAVVQPLAMMAVFTIFFGRLAHVPSNGVPRPIFYFAGLVPWTYFQLAASQSTNSLVSNSALVSKVYFPRMLLPAASVVSGLFDLGIAFVVLLGMTGYYAAQPGSQVGFGVALLFVPVLVVLCAATALATGVWLSALNARYRDVRYIVTFLLQFWMFASPVAYPTSIVPERWRSIYGLNPMAGVIEGFRWALTGSGRAPGPLLGLSAAVVLVLLLGGMHHFKRYEGTVADVI
jgi:lipopolysaccharide transport system permease protein